MKKTLLHLVVAALPALAVAACGGTSDDVADLSVRPIDLSVQPVDLSMQAVDLNMQPADLSAIPPDFSTLPPDLLVAADLSDCSTIYRLASGAYAAVPGSGAITSDTCKTGVTGAQLETARRISNDGMGNVTLSSGDGSVVVGTGPVRCNKGTLINGPLTISDGVCRFTANYEVHLTITADNTFGFVATQLRTGTMSEAGMVCMQPSSCAVNYTVGHKM